MRRPTREAEKRLRERASDRIPVYNDAMFVIVRRRHHEHWKSRACRERASCASTCLYVLPHSCNVFEYAFQHFFNRLNIVCTWIYSFVHQTSSTEYFFISVSFCMLLWFSNESSEFCLCCLSQIKNTLTSSLLSFRAVYFIGN